MRFIIREQDFEQPLASGRWQYELAGRPTGAIESWRLTAVAEGYRFLRVDLDARETDSGHSHLYHLAMTAAGRPERLKFRFFSQDALIAGDLLFENDTLTLLRDINDQHVEQELVMEHGWIFWFPAATGLSLLATEGDDGAAVAAATLDVAANLALHATSICRTFGPEEKLAVARQTVAARPCLIRWAGQARTIWLDAAGWPVKMVRDDGLTAVETQYIRY